MKINMGILNGINIQMGMEEQGCIKLSHGHHYQNYMRRTEHGKNNAMSR